MTRAFESADELVDALFRRALAEDTVSLTIFTGLPIEAPRSGTLTTDWR